MPTDGSATHHAVLHQSTYDYAVCVNTAVEINALNYNVAVRQRIATYGAACSANEA